MSQFQSFESSMGPGPGPILSLTGDSGGAVGPNGSGNINILSENNPPIVPLGPTTYGFGVVTGNPTNNTLLIAPLVEIVTTIDATSTEIFSLLLPTDTSAVITANIIGTLDDFSATCGGIITVVGSNAGAGVFQKTGGIVVTNYIGNPPPNAEGSASGNNLQIVVQGTAGDTWNWTATIQYIFNVA